MQALHKYLGLIIDHKLSWDQCTDAVLKKGHVFKRAPNNVCIFSGNLIILMLTTKF